VHLFHPQGVARKENKIEPHTKRQHTRPNTHKTAPQATYLGTTCHQTI